MRSEGELALDSYFTLSKCSLLFTPERCRRRNIICGIETIQLKAKRNFMDSDLRLQIKLGPVLSSDAVWKDQKFPPVEVSLIFRQGNEKQ